MAEQPKRGQRFTHQTWFDPAWKPQAGQTYKGDAPKAEMVVVKASRTQVWYDFADSNPGNVRGRWVMSLDTFVERYGDALREHVNPAPTIVRK